RQVFDTRGGGVSAAARGMTAGRLLAVVDAQVIPLLDFTEAEESNGKKDGSLQNLGLKIFKRGVHFWGLAEEKGVQVPGFRNISSQEALHCDGLWRGATIDAMCWIRRRPLLVQTEKQERSPGIEPENKREHVERKDKNKDVKVELDEGRWDPCSGSRGGGKQERGELMKKENTRRHT
ncbi:unnamed protein product, partial [Menidia menidia]